MEAGVRSDQTIQLSGLQATCPGDCRVSAGHMIAVKGGQIENN